MRDSSPLFQTSSIQRRARALFVSVDIEEVPFFVDLADKQKLLALRVGVKCSLKTLYHDKRIPLPITNETKTKRSPFSSSLSVAVFFSLSHSVPKDRWPNRRRWLRSDTLQGDQ